VDSVVLPAELINHLNPQNIKAMAPEEVIKTAKAIAQNHPKDQGKQLFVDVSELVQRDSRSGIQRVVRSILIELLTSPVPGFNVEPVYAIPQHGTGYRYAKKFTQRFLNPDDDFDINLSDDLVDVRVGDVFLGLDLTEIIHYQTDFFNLLKQIGVKTYFVLYDLLPVLNPNFFPSHVSPTHSKWLTTIAGSDGLVSISRAVADEMLGWLDVYGPKTLGLFHWVGFIWVQMLLNLFRAKGSLTTPKMYLNGYQSARLFLWLARLNLEKGCCKHYWHSNNFGCRGLISILF